MNTEIDAFTGTVHLPSPDGVFVANYTGTEIGMGGPTSGAMSITLAEPNGEQPLYRNIDAHAPMIWSDDSKYLAFTYKDDDFDAIVLAVFSTKEKKIVSTTPDISVFKFTSFNSKLLQLVQQQGRDRVAIEIDLKDQLAG